MARIGSCKYCGGHNASTCNCKKLKIVANFPIEVGKHGRGQTRNILITNPKRVDELVKILSNK